jgi:hypothetical protein
LADGADEAFGDRIRIRAHSRRLVGTPSR